MLSLHAYLIIDFVNVRLWAKRASNKILSTLWSRWYIKSAKNLGLKFLVKVGSAKMLMSLDLSTFFRSVYYYRIGFLLCASKISTKPIVNCMSPIVLLFNENLKGGISHIIINRLASWIRGKRRQVKADVVVILFFFPSKSHTTNWISFQNG